MEVKSRGKKLTSFNMVAHSPLHKARMILEEMKQNAEDLHAITVIMQERNREIQSRAGFLEKKEQLQLTIDKIYDLKEVEEKLKKLGQNIVPDSQEIPIEILSDDDKENAN